MRTHSGQGMLNQSCRFEHNFQAQKPLVWPENSTETKFCAVVSFPGGTEDPEDGGDLIQTAIRETTEEIGLSRDKIQVLGMFDEAMSINGLYVTPVIAFCGDYESEALKPSPDEIADIFCVTLADLTAPGARIEESLARGKVARFVKSPYPVRRKHNPSFFIT